MGTFVAKPLSRLPSGSVRWLWEPYLARGKLAVFDGDPGIGKSLVTIDLAARLSRGASLPDGKPGDGPTTVLLVNAEDDAADTTRPRAEAAGADLDRLIVLGLGDSVPRLPEDIPALEELVRQHGAGLVVLDPLMAFLPPGVPAGLDQCVRTALTPLAAMAARTGAAVLLVRHLTKASRPLALYRGSGSIGILGACRTGWLAARKPGDPEGRVLAVPKTNLGESPRSLEFRVKSDAVGRAVVEWVGSVDVLPDTLCRPELPPMPVKPKDRAIDWLRRELVNGPRKAAELYEAAAAIGIPERTLNRAKAELRLDSHRVQQKGGAAEWYWYDESAPWPEKAPFKKPWSLPPLPDL